MRRSIDSICTILIALACLCVAVPVRAAETVGAAKGWSLLWSNQDVAARADFAAAVAQNNNDAGSLRGLAVLDRIEDKDSAEVNHLAAMYKTGTWDVCSDAYWAEFQQGCENTGRFDTLGAIADLVLAAPAAHSRLKTDAALASAEVLEMHGSYTAAARLLESLDFVNAWRVIGPFDNKSKSGYDKQFGPETEIDFAKSYAGDNDRPLTWRSLTDIDIDRRAQVGEALSMSSEELSYAVTAVRSPVAQNVVISLDCGGAFRVFVNGTQAASREFYGSMSDSALRSVEAPVNLAAGWNTLLIKVATDDQMEPAGFRVRFTTPSGVAIRLDAEPDHAQGRACDPLSSSAGAPYFVTRELEDQTSSPEIQFLAGESLSDTADYDAEIAQIQQALALAPKSALLHHILSTAYTSAKRDDDSKSEETAAALADPRNVGAQLGDISNRSKEFTNAEQISRMKRLLSTSPNSPQVLSSLSYAYTGASLRAQARQARLSVLVEAHGPDNYNITSDDFSDPDQVKQLESGVKLYPFCEALLKTWAQKFAADQNYTQAIAIYQKLLAWNPTDAETYSSLADACYQTGQKGEALKWYRAALGLTPQSKTRLVQIADIEQELGHKQNAIADYKDAIAWEPADVEVRDKLDVVAGTKRPIDLVPATPAAPIIANLPKAADYKGASCAWSLDEDRLAVYPDGATINEFHEIVTVFDDSAVREMGSYSLSKSSGWSQAKIEIARIIKSDGKTQDCMSDSDDSDANFPSLKPGDTIELQYQVTDYESGELAGQFWSNWVFDSVHGPSKLSRFVLITPPSLAFQVASHGSVPTPSVSTVSGWKVSEWRAVSVPQRKYELEMVSEHDVESWLDISSVKDWASIVHWYLGLSSSRCIADPAITAKTLEITKDAKTEEDKLHAIVSYVRAIPYQSSPFRLSAFVPTEGKQVIREQYGDCKDKAALLTAMLSAVNIKSHMVLLSPSEHGLTAYLPSPRFDHAIARVDTATGQLFVDATADKMQFRGLPCEDEDVPCLIIDPATTDLAKTGETPIEVEAINESVAGVVDDDGRLTAKATLSAQANSGWAFRTVLSQVTASRTDELLSRLTQIFSGGATYDSGSIDLGSNVDAPLNFNFVYHSDHYAVKASDMLILKVPWFSDSTDPSDPTYNAAHRTSDMDMAISRGVAYTHVTVKLPTGYVPQDLPAAIDGAYRWGTYHYAYSFANGVLTADVTQTNTSLRVPAGDVQALLAFEQKQVDEEKRQFVFKKQ